MSLKFFITGTDTDVGKTYISTGILHAFNQARYSTLGLKPLASGCSFHNGILKNDDALALQHASSIKLHYHQINPIAFEPAIAPHIAASYLNRELTVHELKQKTQYALQYPADICIVEGAGGWYVPLNHRETMADYVKITGLKVILVVGMRLGCLNHAILTHSAITHSGVCIAGWIANCTQANMPSFQENLSTLQTWLPSPYLGTVGFNQKIEDVLNLNLITSSAIT